MTASSDAAKDATEIEWYASVLSLIAIKVSAVASASARRPSRSTKLIQIKKHTLIVE
jgi:hypothetical protein